MALFKTKSKRDHKLDASIKKSMKQNQELQIKLGMTPEATPEAWQERYKAKVEAERQAIRTAFESFLQTRILPSLPLIGDSKDLARVAYAIELFANQFLEYPTEFKDGLGKFSGIADEDLDEALGITRMEANIPLVLPNEGREEPQQN